jgi:insulysin
MEDTNYYFSVTTEDNSPDTTSEGLEGALDRFSQFFVAPLFNPEMAERELRAIDSEYRNGKTNDSWRNFQFVKSISNQNNPFSKFGCGNYETLMARGEPPIDELKRFREEFYTTSNMRLAVVGTSSLDALQETVERTFGKLEYSDKPPRREKRNPSSPFFPQERAIYGSDNPAFGPEQLGKYREIIPLLESRKLKVQFATPPMDDPVLQKSRPHRVLSHLLGHESPGSLHQVLTDLGYLTSLTSGAAIDTSDFSLFGVSMSLTPKGMNEKDKVLDLVFQWIALIKKTAMEQPELVAEYHDELRQIATTDFKFRENGDPVDFVSSASEALFDKSAEPFELLSSGSQYDDYDPAVAAAFLERFRPENCMVTVVDSGLQNDESGDWKVEPRYGAKYREREMLETDMKRWENPESIDRELQVPGLNKYIPVDFSLRCDDEGISLNDAEREQARKVPPALLNEGTNWQIYHKMDRSWRVPKTSVKVSVVSPSAYESPRAMTLSRIYQRVLNDDLNSFVYDASLAGCNYRISCAPTGYKLSVSGYSEKIPFLLDTLTTRMLTLIQELREGKERHPTLYDKFERARESLLRETRNYRLDAPYEVANYNSRLVMEENVWYLDDYIDLMEGVNADKNPLTMEQCADVAEACLTGRLKVSALCMGNIDEKGTKEVTDVIARHFLTPSTPLHDSELPRFRSMKLPTREEAVRMFGPQLEGEIFPIKYQELAVSDSEENNAVEVTLQAGSEAVLGYDGVAILDLIAHMAYTSAYNQLRTKEQLGYIVSASTRKVAGGSWGISVVVQSSSASPVKLEERIQDWFKVFRLELERMEPEEIAMEARSVVSQLREGNTKLSQEVSTAWNEISSTESSVKGMMTPAFDRLERLADELVVKTEESSATTLNGNKRKNNAELKSRVLEFFDEVFAVDAPHRRTISARVFSHNSKDEYHATLDKPGVLKSYGDMRYLKEFLETWPVAPYWVKTE